MNLKEDYIKEILKIKKKYKHITEINKYNSVVVNDDLELAISKLKANILSEKCRADRIEEVDLQNKEELLHEILVDMRNEKGEEI